MKEAENVNKKGKGKKIILLLFIITLILLVLGIASYFLYQNNKLPFLNKSANAQLEAENVVLKVGKLIKLPTEKPEIATVTDVTQLKNQTIFKNAQNGDKVLIFTKSKRAIVYRPSENIIVEVGNLVATPTGSESAAGSTSPSEVKKVTVTVFNATPTAGYAGRIGSELASKFSNIEISDTANASTQYDKTIIVDLTGKNSELANSLAKELGGEVDSLPKGEDKPNSEILVILGQ